MDEKQMTKGREAYQMMDEACNQLVKRDVYKRQGLSRLPHDANGGARHRYRRRSVKTV